MKTRNGFVSNSSSCSFFLKLSDFATTKEATEFMIEMRAEYYADIAKRGEYSKRAKEEQILRKKLLKALKNVKNDENLAFCSYNYDTYISKINLKTLTKTDIVDQSIEFPDEICLYVSTCNNITWDLNRYVPDNLHHGDVHDGLFDRAFIKNHEFLVLDYEKRVKVKDGKDGTHDYYGSLKDTIEKTKKTT